jgi:formylglycine-generating enzyme required for sulfatase activity
MGSPTSEANRESDETQHRVTVSSFYMGKYEVTVGEFRAFVNATGYKTTAETSGGGYVWTGSQWERKTDANWKNPYFSQGDSQPVTLVSWYDAVEYCNWRSRAEGLSPAYTVNGANVTWNRNANGYRLPTEAEWEYACRAGTTTPFSTGNNITTSQANYDGNYPYNGNAKGTYRQKTTAVGSFQPNAWGLYDMHGNVWEWCWDWYGDYPRGAQTNPSGAASGSDRVLRGGSWYSGAQYLRSASRHSFDPSSWYNSLGFRLVRP